MSCFQIDTSEPLTQLDPEFRERIQKLVQTAVITASTSTYL